MSARMRGQGRLLAAACGLTLFMAAPAAGAPSLDLSCATYTGGDRICSGEVPSFDGAKLDVDLTLPSGGGASHPLIVLLHGFGNNKHEWESTTDEGDGADKYHWNSHWFAEHGYYVLAYTARGFRDDGSYDDYQPDTPGGTSIDLSNQYTSGTLHLKSRDYEIRDTQWLAAVVAAAHPDVDRGAVAVSGGSYGGGESWMQAAQPTWSFPHDQDPTLPVLQLQVAVPKYPWTDLAYSLAPNGHGGGPHLDDLYESSQGRPDSDTGEGNPIGDPKLSYLAGLTALGQEKGFYEQGQSTTPGDEERPPGINVFAWNARSIAQGDPYDAGGVEDPIVQQIRRGLTEIRSSYYQDEGWAAEAQGRKVAVFSISGWTDDLFPPVESFRQFKYLKRLDPRWPVEVAVGDVGHSRAQNKPATWHRLNDQAWQWLQSNINGSHDQQTTVSSEPTVCTDDAPAERVTATTPEGLANGTLTVAFPGGSLANPLGVADPNGLATDAIVGDIVQPGEQCHTSDGPALGGYTQYSPPLTSELTYIGLGYVRVPYTLTGQTATLDARLFDAAPDGTETLMTRGTYRIDVPAYDTPAGTLRLPLYGNHWRLAPGHRLRLDLTQSDNPTFRPSNEPSSIAFSSATLVLPTLQAGDHPLG